MKHGAAPRRLKVTNKLDTTGHETVLYSFTGHADGSNPSSSLIQDPAGNLYGTTLEGGTAGRGVVFKVDANGHETVLYNFTGGADGGNPEGGLTRDSSSNLYGTGNIGGGTANVGLVYELNPAGQQTVLYSFTGGADGGKPEAGVIRDSAGHLYGTTYSGGKSSTGVVFKLTP